jgi:hypothetical protein
MAVGATEVVYPLDVANDALGTADPPGGTVQMTWTKATVATWTAVIVAAATTDNSICWSALQSGPYINLKTLDTEKTLDITAAATITSITNTAVLLRSVSSTLDFQGTTFAVGNMGLAMPFVKLSTLCSSIETAGSNSGQLVYGSATAASWSPTVNAAAADNYKVCSGNIAEGSIAFPNEVVATLRVVAVVSSLVTTVQQDALTVLTFAGSFGPTDLGAAFMPWVKLIPSTTMCGGASGVSDAIAGGHAQLTYSSSSEAMWTVRITAPTSVAGYEICHAMTQSGVYGPLLSSQQIVITAPSAIAAVDMVALQKESATTLTLTGTDFSDTDGRPWVKIVGPTIACSGAAASVELAGQPTYITPTQMTMVITTSAAAAIDYSLCYSTFEAGTYTLVNHIAVSALTSVTPYVAMMDVSTRFVFNGAGFVAHSMPWVKLVASGSACSAVAIANGGPTMVSVLLAPSTATWDTIFDVTSLNNVVCWSTTQTGTYNTLLTTPAFVSVFTSAPTSAPTQTPTNTPTLAPVHAAHVLSHIGGCSLYVNTADGSSNIGCAVQGFDPAQSTGDSAVDEAFYTVLKIEGSSLYTERSNSLTVTLGPAHAGGLTYSCANPTVTQGTGVNGEPSDILACEMPCVWEFGAALPVAVTYGAGPVFTFTHVGGVTLEVQIAPGYDRRLVAHGWWENWERCGWGREEFANVGTGRCTTFAVDASPGTVVDGDCVP